MANLGTKLHTAGNTKIFKGDYSDWLAEGTSLEPGATVVLSPAFTAAITDIVVSAIQVLPSHRVSFKLSGGSANEVFTLDVQITDSRGEIKNDTLGFRVIAP